MRIPFVDLAAQHAEVAAEVQAGWAAIVDSGAYILGPEVAAFEQAYARFAHVQHCVGVASGTDALELALRAVGVGAGDEVILPANTFVASALAVVRAGATPVLVDVDPVHLLVDVSQVLDRIGPRTRAVMPVHLFGQIAPVETLLPLAGDGVAVIEDAAQAQGATRNGQGAGGFGVVAGTSFYPGKNLGAYGDAGAVLTTDDEVAARVRRLRNYGSEVKYEHPEVGFNSRLDTMQAVVLSAKLARLPAWNEARRAAARRYAELLGNLADVRLPSTLPGNEHVWHLYVIRVPRRDDVLLRLQDAGIGVGIHYPVPVHLQGAFSSLGHRPGDFPVSEAAAADMLSLPMHPHLRPSDQEEIAAAVEKALR